MVPCPHPTPPPSRPWSEDKAPRGHWNANVWEPGLWAGTKAGGAGSARDPTAALCPSSLPRAILPGCVTLDKSEPQLIHMRSWKESLIRSHWIYECLRGGPVYSVWSYSLPRLEAVKKIDPLRRASITLLFLPKMGKKSDKLKLRDSLHNNCAVFFKSQGHKERLRNC